MAKIPKGLSDKDMLQGYVEQVTLESQFLAAEEAEDKRRRARAGLSKPEKNIALTGFTDELTEELGRKLLELKMELFRDGIKNYTMKVKKDGQSIIIKPVETRQKTGGKSVRKLFSRQRYCTNHVLWHKTKKMRWVEGKSVFIRRRHKFV